MNIKKKYKINYWYVTIHDPIPQNSSLIIEEFTEEHAKEL